MNTLYILLALATVIWVLGGVIWQDIQKLIGWMRFRR